MHPAAHAVAVFDPAPVAVFGGDAQGHVAAFVDPVDPVGEGGATADVAFGGFERDKTRQRQVCDRAGLVLGMGHAHAQRHQ